MKAATCFAGMLISVTLLGQTLPSGETIPAVQTTGEAVVRAQPDQAQIEIGVVTQASTAQEASAKNAEQLSQALAALKKAAGQGSQVKTSSYNVNPNFRYPREGGTPTINGYTATNVVSVTLRDLSAVGPVIDAATRSGANSINSIQFTLSDDKAARAQALREAALRARGDAEAIAGALGMKLGRVLSATQGEPARVFPVMKGARMQMAEAMAGPPTPIESGTVEIRATVTLAIALSQ